MKKILLAAIFLSASSAIKAQSVLLSENFDSYNGLVSSIPPGFTITWNDTSATSKSFYTSTGFCGVACNAYKFGWDSATIITPVFSNPGSVSFYLKGNGTYKPNKFIIYESPDGITWNQVTSIDSIPSVSQTINLGLNSSATQLKFYYDKDSLGYNAGFDDLIVYGPTGINAPKGISVISLFPSPGSGMVTVNFQDNYFSEVEIRIVNILGKELKQFNLKGISEKFIIDLSALPDGIYMAKIKSPGEESVKRIVIKR